MTDTAFEERRVLLEDWRHAMPASTAARIVLAVFWRRYAWQARGSDYAAKVSPEQWTVFRARIAKEREMLAGLRPANPGAYQVMLTFARDESWPRGQLDALYRAAVSQYPDFLHFYIQRASLLEPKWHGAPGEWKRYADSLLWDPGGSIGQMAYSLMAVEQLGNYRMSEFFDKTGLSWLDVKMGFELREQRFGLSNADWNMLLYFACAAPDRAIARKAVEHIGDNWAPWLWKEKRIFDFDVAWARS
jgi:hypothetical protein